MARIQEKNRASVSELKENSKSDNSNNASLLNSSVTENFLGQARWKEVQKARARFHDSYLEKNAAHSTTTGKSTGTIVTDPLNSSTSNCSSTRPGTTDSTSSSTTVTKSSV